MSELLGVEERARLRVMVNAIMPSSTLSESIIALLDEVDRLAEALGAAEENVQRLRYSKELRDEEIDAQAARAERAEADLADEKRQHAEMLTRTALDIDKLLLRVAGFNEPWDRGYCQGVQDAAYAVRERRALLDTATEETQGAP